MTSSYPGAIDALTNPVSTDTQSAVPHAAQHANANDAIEAIEAFIGVAGSTDPASIEKRLIDVTAAAAAHAALTQTHGISAWGATLVDDASASAARTTLVLNNVTNTSDANKPVSTAQQTALNLKADLASPTFTGTVGGITAAMVGAPTGSGTSTGTNTGDSATPAETTTTIGALLNSATSKTTPVDADHMGLMDSAAGGIWKKLSWANLKTALSSIFVLLAGKSGGQTIIGGTGASENLTLQSTSHATKGKIYLGSNSVFDGATGQIGLGTIAPLTGTLLDVGGYISSPTIGTPLAVLSSSANGISGVEMRNAGTGTSSDFRFVISDTGGHYIAFMQPAITNTNAAIFGLARATTDYILSAGGTDRDLAIGMLGSGKIVFAIGSAEKVRIQSDGFCGIRTSAIGAPLTVHSDAYGAPLTSGSTQTYAVSRLQSGGGNVVLDCGINGSSGVWLQSCLKASLGSVYPILLNPNGGDVAIGGNSSISPTDATTNAIADVLTVSKNSIGAGAAGLGARILLAAKSSTTNNVRQASIASEWLVATHATRTSRLTVSASDYNAAREGMRVESDGSVARLGFYGATAVIKPTALTTTVAAAPAGGTGTAAGGWDTSGNRDLAIATINNLKTRVDQLETKLQALGLLT